MAEPFAPNDAREHGASVRETDSYVTERQPWSPAQFVAIVLGVVFVVIGGIALARTGVDFNRLTSDHVNVAGSVQTQLMGLLELIYGAFLLLAGSIPGAGRGGMSFLGILSLVFGIIVAAQPSSFYRTLGIGRGYAVFLIAIGAVLMITSMVSPVYRGFSRRYDASRRDHSYRGWR